MTSRISREALAAVWLAAAFAALTAWVTAGGPLPGEARLWRWAQAHPSQSEAYSNFQQLFSALGSPFVAGLTALTAAVVVLRNVGVRPALLILAASAIALVERPLSDLIGQTEAAAEVGQVPGGYPSGHALFVASTYGAIAWVALRHGRREVAAIALALVLLMGLVRVTDRSHLVCEVLAGYLLGAAWLCLVVAVTAERPSRRR